jgi:flagellar biosynthesis protein FliR
MTNILNFSPGTYFFFFVILIRISGIFITAPILSSPNVPRTVRLYMMVLFSLIFFNVLPPVNFQTNLPAITYFLIGMKELIIGLLLGSVPRVIFAAIDFAGTIIGFQMGFSIANVVDPQTDTQVSIIASFEIVLATLIFLAIDGHHIFIEAISISYEQIPINGVNFGGNKIGFLLRITADLFILGLKLSAPYVVALLLANIIMGFMARSVPQMNVFVVGFPFTIGMGLLLLVMGMPFLGQAITNMFGRIDDQVIQLIQLLSR